MTNNSAYRYTRVSGSWTLQDTGLPVNTPGDSPSGPEPGMRFGAAVAVGGENLIFIGAPYTNGSSAAFGSTIQDVGLVEARRTGSGDWSASSYRGVLRPPPLSTTELGGGRFGTAVAADSAARRLAVGYPGAGSTFPLPSGSRRGAVWVYERPDGVFADRFE